MNTKLGLAAASFIVGAGFLAGGCNSGRGHGRGGNNDGFTSNTSDFATTNADGGMIVTDGCSDSAKLVYVVDQDSTLYSFDVPTLKFTQVGTLNCPAQFGATPFSMSVDRSANAWVLYNSGEMFEVSTTDASCTATSHQVGQAGLENFGMGFASDSSGSTDETLYIAGGSASNAGTGGTAKFATMTVPALSATAIGSVQGWPELTGTGKGELWGFFPSDSVTPRVAQLDKATGADGTVYQLGALSGTPAAWAFAFWGGNFYVFLQKANDASTSVYKVDGTTGALTTALSDTGKIIVGAGVSTCAPVGPIN
ncbi:MAG: hypothetical protein ABI321_14095 [Polyangia bacterium]